MLYLRLNEAGRLKAEKFFKKYDKEVNSPFYSMYLAIDEVEIKISSGNRLSYELSSTETTTGLPEILDLDPSDFENFEQFTEQDEFFN